MQEHHPFRQLLAHCETFWDISSNFEQIWANLSNFEQFWAISNNFEQFWAVLSNFEQFWAVFSGQLGSFRAILSIFVGQVCHVEQFWTIFGSTIWHCWPWTVFKMSQLRLLWDILLWLKKVADVNPTDLDPKTRSVIDTALHTSHSTLVTLHFPLYTLHFTLCTSHFTIPTPHSTHYVSHSTPHFLHTPDFAFYPIPHSTGYSALVR